MDFDFATNADLTPTTAHAPISGWHALNGLALGHLRGLSPGTDMIVHVETVVEETTDLAVADRVAYVMSSRTGISHVVLAAAEGYLVASVGPTLDWAAAMRLVPVDYMPRIVSVASAEGVLPVLLPISA